MYYFIITCVVWEGAVIRKQTSQRYKRLTDALGITVITFAFIGLFSQIPVGLGFLNPIGNSISSFDIYDLVFSKFRGIQPADTNIVLVNIGRLDREGIGRQLDIISRCSPSAVGLDILFIGKKEKREDSVLLGAVRGCRNLVLASRLGRYNSGKDTYEELITSDLIGGEDLRYGFSNLPDEDEEGFRTVRRYRPFTHYREWPEYSFAFILADKFSTIMADRLTERRSDKEIINFRGNLNSFYFIDTYDLFTGRYRPDIFKNKIVLMGFMGEDIRTQTFEDMYFTPLNEHYTGRSLPDMYGVVIHANIISMILNGSYINIMPAWLSFMLSFTACWLSVWVLLLIKSSYRDWFGAVFKLYLFTISSITISLGILLFNSFNYRINLTLLVAALVLGPTCMDLYTILTKWIHYHPGKIKNEKSVKIINISDADVKSGH
ncbi:MAG: CHASE2 domain-containing protein [Syntrophothermus sp.]